MEVETFTGEGLGENPKIKLKKKINKEANYDIKKPATIYH